MSQEWRREAATFWFDQRDAAANDEAGAKFDDGSDARVQGHREEEEETKRQQSKRKRGLSPIYKARR